MYVQCTQVDLKVTKLEPKFTKQKFIIPSSSTQQCSLISLCSHSSQTYCALSSTDLDFNQPLRQILSVSLRRCLLKIYFQLLFGQLVFSYAFCLIDHHFISDHFILCASLESILHLSGCKCERFITWQCYFCSFSFSASSSFLFLFFLIRSSLVL